MGLLGVCMGHVHVWVCSACALGYVWGWVCTEVRVCVRVSIELRMRE
jgi:hypothetical protein